ncbi:hypothetical protein V7152_06000 [Neobacillus drentensis]|uniref:hypothetical protein n=1 Tax=Neobacillus drentensis TaxID=220684 RepID=UPI002FFE0FD2
MFKIILIVLIIILAIIILSFMLIFNRKQATETFSIPTFLENNSYNQFDNVPMEQHKSIIEKINDYFKVKDEENIIDGDSNDDDGE